MDFERCSYCDRKKRVLRRHGDLWVCQACEDKWNDCVDTASELLDAARMHQQDR